MRIKYLGPYSGNILSLKNGEVEIGTVRAIFLGDRGAFYFFYNEDIDNLHYIAPIIGAKIIESTIPKNWVIEPVERNILDGTDCPSASGKLFDRDRFGNLFVFFGEKELNAEKRIIDLICGN